MKYVCSSCEALDSVDDADCSLSPDLSSPRQSSLSPPDSSDSALSPPSYTNILELHSHLVRWELNIHAEYCRYYVISIGPRPPSTGPPSWRVRPARTAAPSAPSPGWAATATSGMRRAPAPAPAGSPGHTRWRGWCPPGLRCSPPSEVPPCPRHCHLTILSTPGQTPAVSPARGGCHTPDTSAAPAPVSAPVMISQVR